MQTRHRAQPSAAEGMAKDLPAQRRAAERRPRQSQCRTQTPRVTKVERNTSPARLPFSPRPGCPYFFPPPGIREELPFGSALVEHQTQPNPKRNIYHVHLTIPD